MSATAPSMEHAVEHAMEDPPEAVAEDAMADAHTVGHGEPPQQPPFVKEEHADEEFEAEEPGLEGEDDDDDEEEELLLVDVGSTPNKIKPKPSPLEPDVADLQLLSQVNSLRFKSEGARYDEAHELVLAACHVAKCGPAGSGKLVCQRTDWRLGCWACVAISAAITIVVFLLLLCRVSVRLTAARDSVLVATGLLALPEIEPVVGTGLALQQLDVLQLATLPIETLRHVRDVTLAHRGIWRCLRVTRAMRFGGLMTWLETFDGTALRIASGRAWIRLGALGEEEELELPGSHYHDHTRGTNELITASALLYRVASPNGNLEV